MKAVNTKYAVNNELQEAFVGSNETGEIGGTPRSHAQSQSDPIQQGSKTNPKMSNRARCVLLFMIVGLAAATLFRETLTEVITAGIGREDSSHTVFIPFLVLYFFWISKSELLSKEMQFEWIGIVSAIIVLLTSVLFKSVAYQVQYLLFIALTLSLIFAILGRGVLSIAAFPVFFLVTATPIPEHFYNNVADVSRTIALGFSLKIVSFLGVPYYREGWIVQIPNGRMHVNVNCSGIRYLISYIVFSIVYAYLFKKTFVQRFITILASLPISICASTLRLTSIFTLSYYIDPRLAGRWPHTIISWSVFAAVTIAAIAIDVKFLRNSTQSQKQGYSAN